MNAHRLHWRNAGWLLPIAGLLATLAVFNPRLQREAQAPNALFVIDITQSMNVADVAVGGAATSRLRFSRELVKQSLRELPCGAKAGVAIFAEYRPFVLLTPVEVCENLPELATVIDRIEPRMSWAGASEIAKGVLASWRIAKAQEPAPSIVFITDGHEAPPLNPRFRPQLEGTGGEVKGVIVGVGGDTLREIPKLDTAGKSLGVWEATEVMQTDPQSLGQRGTTGEEMLVDETGKPIERIRATGTEHLSSLKETHLRSIAEQIGFEYVRMPDGKTLAERLVRLSDHRVESATQTRTWFAGAALLVLLAGWFMPIAASVRPHARASLVTAIGPEANTDAASRPNASPNEE